MLVYDDGMPDIFSKSKRSNIMSRIRGKNTKTETDFLRTLSARVYPMGFRYRKHVKNLPGSPDAVFAKNKLVIFIDGCFWHGCPKCFVMPKSNRKFWREKIERNKVRDKKVVRQLRYKGWKVVRVREHQAKKGDIAAEKVVRLLKA
jgi:DNA mismatch endonuclease (patch repair protein)